MFNHENLKGRVAVVTGGGGVLCGGFAKTLAAQGCKVAVLDLLRQWPTRSTPTADRRLPWAAMCWSRRLCAPRGM